MNCCQKCKESEDECGSRPIPYMVPVLVFLQAGQSNIVGQHVQMPMIVQVQVDLCEDCRDEMLAIILNKGTVRMDELKKWLAPSTVMA